ncbi:uncharacterized protein MONOS_9229 [Monocercomonoides exilis]|uniref:uncharacterized protein n=1 Tax=Monocercomonoides exilis TaxID=2049356 RepID=UPI003559CF0C|nr:hypothetical protein MONOS_9229 [Monocercomonoides exilis]|eukprot:MONOS_9229.1-p1 / transcript=MONOS_9229.1 / gene=MONOS_9229 / organism=Monocercomonoides_exilis_PA203 / gene_product=unspecified product / transcript_product=unspecified product / location=Mono_scaffold00373:11696-13157(+) / protein_length=445 / sequence_SO=supercontig / SO=protein_coding / is_pseudo=false
MKEFVAGRTEDRNREMAPKEKFSKLFEELKSCSVSEQKEKIEEMNRLIDEMNKEELYSTFTKELFEKIDKMIEEEKLTMENAILLLKHMGYCNILKSIYIEDFFFSSLNGRFWEMIDDEEKKKEKRNEKLLAELCECYVLLNIGDSSQLISVCVPYLLEAALKKEDENEEAQKEVEMILLALTNVGYIIIDEELYLNEIKEIIEYHQEHHNLTHLAYQSAWGFLIKRFVFDKSLEEVITNELHFAREVESELDGLMQSVDWKKKEEEKEKTERKAMDIISRWISSIRYYLKSCHLWNEEYVELISRIVDVLRASRDNHSEIGEECIRSFNAVAKNRAVKLDALLKSGAIDAALEEIQRPTSNERMASEILRFFQLISLRLKEKEEDEMEEAKRKELKRKMFEKMEEEGYEEIIISLHERLNTLKRKYFYGDELSLNISDYSVYI